MKSVRWRAYVCVLLLMALVLGLSRAATHRVPDDYETIQSAIFACVDYDTVLVAPDTYTGPENRNLDFHGIDLVLLSEAGPESTVIDCNYLGRGFYFHSNETFRATVEGFSIVHGVGVAPDNGAGICCDGSSPRIVNCIIAENESLDDGGGIYIGSGNYTPEIIGCTIVGNSAASRGGGVASYGSEPILQDCVVAGNTARWGGGLYTLSDDPLDIRGCTIAGNSATEAGGAISGDGSQPTIRLERTILWNNCAPRGHEISGSPDLYFLCCALDSLGIEVWETTLVHVIGGVVYDPPVFCDAEPCENAPTTKGTYTLDLTSPCLPENSPCGELIGALGVGCGFAAGVAEIEPNRGVIRIYPNPTTGPVTIDFTIPTSGIVSAQILDVSGRVVRDLFHGSHPNVYAGESSLTWDGRDNVGRQVTSGVYVARVNGSLGVSTVRLVMAR